MKPIRIAQIGTMHDHARATFESLLECKDCFEVVGLAEIEAGREGRLYPEVPHYTVEQLLEMDLDAVAIETEEVRATEYAQMFIEKGIAVHLDKPGSPDRAAFHRLVDTAKANGTVLHLGYMYRYNPLIADLIARAKAGEWGDIYSVEVQMSVHHPAEKHTWLTQFPGGMMYFLGCHLVDLVLQLQGIPEKILPLNARTGQSDANCEDFGFAVLSYPNGHSFIKTCAAEYNGYDRRQLVICGTKGTVEVKPLEVAVPEVGAGLQKTCYRIVGPKEENNNFGNHNADFQDTAPQNRYNGMMRAFARYVRGKAKNPYTYEYEKTLFDTLLQCCGVE